MCVGCFAKWPSVSLLLHPLPPQQTRCRSARSTDVGGSPWWQRKPWCRRRQTQAAEEGSLRLTHRVLPFAFPGHRSCPGFSEGHPWTQRSISGVKETCCCVGETMKCLNSSLHISFLWFPGDHQYNHPILSSAAQTPTHGERRLWALRVPSPFRVVPSWLLMRVRHQTYGHDSLMFTGVRSPQGLSPTLRPLTPSCPVSETRAIFQHAKEGVRPFPGPFSCAI